VGYLYIIFQPILYIKMAKKYLKFESHILKSCVIFLAFGSFRFYLEMFERATISGV